VGLRRVGFIALPPGDAPGFDHADLHRPSGRLYVAHTGADRVDVIACAAGAYLRALPGLPGVAGVLIDPAHDLLATTDRGAARVSLYRCSDEALVGRVHVGPRPNGIAYDPGRRRLFVFNIGDPPGANPTASVVDVAGLRVEATFPLPGRPRWALYDPATDRVYANIQSPARIAVIDAAAPWLVGTLEVPAAGPHGLALTGDRLFCAADGGVLVALRRDGRVLASTELVGAPDVIWHDPASGRVYVAIGSPGVVQVVDGAAMRTIEVVETEEGAHTTAWHADARTLYVFCPRSGGAAVYVDV
jgi:DNA-binding beta-propeller fold protein YncE